MKPFYYTATLLFAVLFFFVCCKKDPTKNAKLPDATQEGRNTAGFIINNEVVIPYAQCGGWVGHCRAISADTFTNTYYSQGKRFGFSIVRETKDSYVSLQVSVNFSGTTGNKVDSVSADLYCRNVGDAKGTYYGPILPRTNSRFIVTRIDTLNGIISGEFELVLFNQETSNTVVVKDGRFDLHFSTCVCSK